MKAKTNNKKIALVAGALDLPFITRDALRKAGWGVFVIGLKNFYDPKLNPDIVVTLGHGGYGVRQMKQRGINKLVFVGALGHVNLSDIWPDFWSISVLLSVMKHQRGYDSMAVAFIDALKKRGLEVLAAQDLAPELTFEKAGIQTKTKPSKSDLKDIERAIQVSHTIGSEDIGASVVVDKQVIAVEAAEGTAKMLDRVVELRKKHKKSGGVFAKMTKPNQDLHIDIPAIGVDTVKAVASAKLHGIIVNAKTCFVVNKEDVLKAANKAKIFIKAI
ncbi:MAG: UDP-2,3-diacylglucosamine diphosphatase LpxI [Alphaproteobacteria bacterium]|nr:UDP-2,3-diacylglucosamine diphosphatase LpxI [Alphaproteobacteria bacterium]